MKASQGGAADRGPSCEDLPQATLRVLVMAGGTGGHVIPALSLARGLAEVGVDVEWLGSPRGIENRLVPDAGIKLHQLSIAGLRGNGWRGWLLAPLKVTRAISQALVIMKHAKPDVVVGMGGFASGPGGVAARLTRTALLIHEQNARPGLTNRMLSRLTPHVYAGFADAFTKPAQVVGNPVRADIAALGETPRQAEEIARRSPRVLVVGGSLGAMALNEQLGPALALLDGKQRPDVWHQCGDRHQDATEQAYQAAGVSARVTPFIADMASAYAWADLVVCRSGALTVSELAAAAKPAVLVPFPHAVDDHQFHNAQRLVEAEAGICIRQSDLDANRLCRELGVLLNPQTLALMAVRARRVARLEATAQLVDACLKLANKESRRE